MDFGIFVLVIGVVLAITVLGIVFKRNSMRFEAGLSMPSAPREKADTLMGFYVKGNQLGFKFSELRALMRLAKHFEIASPSTMLLTRKHLDRCLRQIFEQGAREGLLSKPETVALLYKVLEYRMGVERNRSRHRAGMETSRMLEAGQILKLLLPGIGVFQTTIIENFRSHIAVEMPVGKGVPITHKWKNQRLDVYFWRRGDAMYYFSSTVINDPDKTALIPHLHLAHAEELLRTQKRASIRVQVMKEGRVLPVTDAQRPTEDLLGDLGFLCRVIDISETGAAIVVRGKVQPGREIKLQVDLGGLPVVLSGTIKAANLNVTHNASLLHIEADPPMSQAMRIRVMAYVLGLVTEEAPVEVAEASEGLLSETMNSSTAQAETATEEMVETRMETFGNEQPGHTQNPSETGENTEKY